MPGYFAIAVDLVDRREVRDDPGKTEYELRITLTSFDDFKGDVALDYSVSDLGAALTKTEEVVYVPEDGSAVDDVSVYTDGDACLFTAHGQRGTVEDSETEVIPP